MLSVRFFLANSKIDQTSIYLIAIYNGKKYKKGISISIQTKFWNHEAQRAVSGVRYKEGARINHEIERWRMATERLFHNIETNKLEVLNSEQLWHWLNCELEGTPYTAAPRSSYFVDYFEQVYIPRFLSSKSLTRIKRFHVVLSKLKSFEVKMNKHYRLDEINISFYREFQQYIASLNHTVNYFGTLIKTLKQVLREAQDVDKIHTNTEYLNAAFKAVSSEVDTVYLTRDELQRIAELEIDDEFINSFYPESVSFGRQSLKQSYTIVKNRFLIGAFTGLRFSDLNRLTENDILDNKITIVTKKTGQKVVIPLHPVVRTIIDSGFDLSQSLSDQKSRLYIKNICKYAQINQLIDVRSNKGLRQQVSKVEKYTLVSTHTARRSFATNAYLAGVPVIGIMKITGHKTEREFMKYIRISQDENADVLSRHDFFK